MGGNLPAVATISTSYHDLLKNPDTEHNRQRQNATSGGLSGGRAPTPTPTQPVDLGLEHASQIPGEAQGLRCDQVAEFAGAAGGYRIVPFRGEYYELVPERSHLVNNLIYPVPDPSFPFLGVHLTRMVDGTIHAGPNAVLALAREGYGWGDISRAQLREHITNRGLWRLARRYWRTGAGEVWRSLNKAAFARALQRLVPDIEADDLVPSPAGVRAQAMDPAGELEDDFAITVASRSTHVLNAPSPAATSSLEIAKMIVDRIDG